MNWLKNGIYMIPDTYPHQEVTVDKIDWKTHKKAFIAKWTSNFDCSEKTQFWWTILDKPFDISSLNSKHRYEINKGNKYFYTKIINPIEYREELYDVFLESLQGYKNPHITPKDEFDKTIDGWSLCKECIFFGVFRKEDNKLCGYSDCYDRDRYIPISSLKTRVSCEKQNVNFALIFGICEFFKDRLKHGCYLCDGTRNCLHETNFQSFLEKYFCFRKAYCQLHIEYRGVVKPLLILLFPLRRLIKKCKISKKLDALFLLKAWSKGLEK